LRSWRAVQLLAAAARAAAPSSAAHSLRARRLQVPCSRPAAQRAPQPPPPHSPSPPPTSATLASLSRSVTGMRSRKMAPTAAAMAPSGLSSLSPSDSSGLRSCRAGGRGAQAAVSRTAGSRRAGRASRPPAITQGRCRRCCCCSGDGGAAGCAAAGRGAGRGGQAPPPSATDLHPVDRLRLDCRLHRSQLQRPLSPRQCHALTQLEGQPLLGLQGQGAGRGGGLWRGCRGAAKHGGGVACTQCWARPGQAAGAASWSLAR
jgi:hypothetical protein